MNWLIGGFFEWVINKIIGGMIWGFAFLANSINSLALNETKLPWVQNLRTDMLAVACTLLGLAVAYKALQTYILWGEGTADPDGSVLAKSILRALLYIGVSGFLATAVFTFGLQLAQVVAASPLMDAAQTTHSITSELTQLPTNLLGLVLGVSLAFAGGVALMLVALFQMAIRAAELVVYVVAGPVVALGQLSAGGGTWVGWWTNLVILSLSQAVTILCFKGFVATTQGLTASHAPAWVSGALGGAGPAAAFAGATVSDSLIGARVLLVVLFMVGWMVVAIRGPHLLRQWSYRSGVGGAGVYVSQQMAPAAVRKHLGGTRVGGFLGL